MSSGRIWFLFSKTVIAFWNALDTKKVSLTVLSEEFKLLIGLYLFKFDLYLALRIFLTECSSLDSEIKPDKYAFCIEFIPLEILLGQESLYLVTIGCLQGFGERKEKCL